MTANAAPARTVVFGASGLIGRRIVARLAAERGAASVIAAVRRPDPLLARLGVATRVGDATDAAAVAFAMDGATSVINCVMGSNATLVRSATTIAVAAGIQRVKGLVHLSSVAVYGDAEGDITEHHHPGAVRDPYAAAKWASEAVVRQAASRVPTAILRPAIVYGPASELWTARIARLLASGRLGDLGARGTGVCNLVFMDDVAAAAVAALDRGSHEPRVWNVAAPDPPSWNEYLTSFAAALALQARPIPGWRLALERAVAYPLKAAELAAGRRGWAVPDPITPGLAGLFDRQVRYHSPVSLELLPSGYTDHAVGIGRSADWARAELFR